ncbi:mucin-2 [Streptomyces sp. CAU 1734]|uniref:PP2C family protein-serine/threonine phosphatase n=1 Tax=Streptomyces sp. CAU 1734 TaxID=3140360 RepID=UPI0032614913
MNGASLIRTYATAQNVGGRSAQCDATAVRTAPTGARAYVLLDGIGSSRAVRDWTRRAAASLARAAARRGDAEAGLRATYAAYAADPNRQDPYARAYMPSAAAVVAVTVPGKPLSVAWAGDSRAYLLRDGIAFRLTQDHNLRRVYPPTASHDGGNRNRITSYLGSSRTDEEVRELRDHPAIETATAELTRGSRLLLASDGAYEPLADAGHDLFTELDGEPLARTVRRFVDLAVTTARTQLPPDEHQYVDNATALLADLA